MRLLAGSKIAGADWTLLLAALAVAGCAAKPQPAVEAIVFPTDYRQQIAILLTSALSDRADFRNSLIAEPVMMQVGESQHYVVCVQINGHNQHNNKVAVYLGTTITQFVDATPAQCGNAQYQPFKELAAMSPG